MSILKQWAMKLNGRKYGNEVSHFEIKELEENGLVAVYGRSDDLSEFVGAINDEFDCYKGGTIYLTHNGIFKNKCEDDCPYAIKERNKCKAIAIIWGKIASWEYETSIPHEVFEIVEDGKLYCRGIIFDVKSLEVINK